MQNKTRITIALAGCALAGAALADPPAGYYDSITGTDGATLSAQLNTLLNNAVTRSYGDARTLLQDIDEDPNDPSRIICVYNGASVNSTWDSGSTWNREHTWPRSLGVGDSGSDYSDLHQLHPCNPGINSSRGNLRFGTFPGMWDPNRYGFTYRGRMARMAFYMKTRYPYLNVSSLGIQTQFVDWHYDEMPGDVENTRNDRVYNAQQNRNAFADHPEWVWAIFGDAPSDAQIILAGETPVDGATSQTVDLGSVIGSADFISPYELVLDKSGAAPTTYAIDVSGDAESVSRYQFGFPRLSQQRTHDIVLSGTGFGAYQAVVTVDQTEVTSAGAGQGASDGDDTLTLNAMVLDHAVPSLSALDTVTDITLDLGVVTLGEPATMVSIDVHNLGSLAHGADLDLDAISAAGDTASFFHDFAPIASIPAGSAVTLTFESSAFQTGDFNATYTIETSDEDLPGAIALSDLTINVTMQVVSPCLADVNGDGNLDPSDFSAWINAFNQNAPGCDQNSDGTCTPADFTAWINNYNAGC